MARIVEYRTQLSMQKRILFLTLAALLFGCAERPPLREQAAPQLDRPALAEQAVAAGDYTKAIELYRQLTGESEPPQSYVYRYRTALALFRAGRNNQAGELLAALPTDELPLELRLKVQLLLAELDLKRDPDHTLSLLLSPAAPENLLPENNSLYARYHKLRALAFNRLGNHLEAAREYIMRGLYLTDGKTIEENQMGIWQSLATYPPEMLQRLRVQPPPDVLSGWLELVETAKDYSLSPRQMQQRIIDWRQRYSGHPATEQVLQRLLTRSQKLSEHPADIAVLLPLSGRFARAASAIQEGLFAAYYADPKRSDITLRVYDVTSQPDYVDTAYALAIADGADFVIGPLDKEAVTRLASKETLPVPTLALNHAASSFNPNLYQFGLAPEDEAREVAERAWAEGHDRAALLQPKGALGDRLSAAFAQRWQELGGTIASESRYEADNSDFSQPIKSLLNLNDSEFRKRRLNQLIAGRVEFIPRRRQDIDFVFLTAYPRQARLIRPQLEFHHASELPVYATSHLFTGELDRDADRDMDGIAFCDMPWTLKSDSPEQAIGRENATLLQSHRGQLQRLVALGVDAYQLVPLLPLLASHPYEQYRGETGRLSLDENRRIKRQLQWATFKQGVPRLEQERVMELDGNWQKQY